MENVGFVGQITLQRSKWAKKLKSEKGATRDFPESSMKGGSRE